MLSLLSNIFFFNIKFNDIRGSSKQVFDIYRIFEQTGGKNEIMYLQNGRATRHMPKLDMGDIQ